MTGRIPTGLVMGVAMVLGLAMAAAIAITGGVGHGGPEPGSDGRVGVQATTASGLSAQDAAVLARMRPWITDWNVAARGWIRALEVGRQRFLGKYPAYTRRMDLDSLRIRLSAAKLENSRLRSLVKRLGDVYRKQFRAVRAANDAVVAGDELRTRAAIDRLERTDDEKTRAATALVDAFPELAGDLNRLK